MEIRRFISFMVVLTFFTTPMTMAEPDASQLVKQADLLLRGQHSSIQYVEFTVYRPDRVIKRKMVNYLMGKKYSLSHVVEPVRDCNTVILKRADDVWMHVPTVSKTIRIPSSMMHDGVLGGDFNYDDITKQTTFTDDYTPKIIGLSKAMQEEHGKVYVLDLTPLPDRPTAYKKVRLWIREQGAVILRIHYYNDQMKLNRAMALSDIREVGSQTIPTKWTMTDLTKKGHYTTLRIIDAKFDTIEDVGIFDKQSLESPPPVPEWKEEN
jgi:hypothetical protein